MSPTRLGKNHQGSRFEGLRVFGSLEQKPKNGREALSKYFKKKHESHQKNLEDDTTEEAQKTAKGLYSCRTQGGGSPNNLSPKPHNTNPSGFLMHQWRTEERLSKLA